MFPRLKQLMRLFAATKPTLGVLPVQVSEDLEVAEFRLLAPDNQQWPVRVSIEALASAAEMRVRSPNEAVSLVRSQSHKLELAALNALARGDVVDGVIVLRPRDLAP